MGTHSPLLSALGAAPVLRQQQTSSEAEKAAKDALAAHAIADAARIGNEAAGAFVEEATGRLSMAQIRRRRAKRLHGGAARAAVLGADRLAALGSDAALAEDTEAEKLEIDVTNGVRSAYGAAPFFLSPREAELWHQSDVLQSSTVSQAETALANLLVKQMASAANYGDDFVEGEEVGDGEAASRLAIAADAFGGDTALVLGIDALGAITDTFKASREKLEKRLATRKERLEKLEEKVEDGEKGFLMKARIKMLKKSIAKLTEKLAKLTVAEKKVAVASKDEASTKAAEASAMETAASEMEEDDEGDEEGLGADTAAATRDFLLILGQQIQDYLRDYKLGGVSAAEAGDIVVRMGEQIRDYLETYTAEGLGATAAAGQDILLAMAQQIEDYKSGAVSVGALDVLLHMGQQIKDYLASYPKTAMGADLSGKDLVLELGQQITDYLAACRLGAASAADAPGVLASMRQKIKDYFLTYGLKPSPGQDILDDIGRQITAYLASYKIGAVSTTDAPQLLLALGQRIKEYLASYPAGSPDTLGADADILGDDLTPGEIEALIENYVKLGVPRDEAEARVAKQVSHQSMGGDDSVGLHHRRWRGGGRGGRRRGWGGGGWGGGWGGPVIIEDDSDLELVEVPDSDLLGATEAELGADDELGRFRSPARRARREARREARHPDAGGGGGEGGGEGGGGDAEDEVDEYGRRSDEKLQAKIDKIELEIADLMRAGKGDSKHVKRLEKHKARLEAKLEGGGDDDDDETGWDVAYGAGRQPVATGRNRFVSFFDRRADVFGADAAVAQERLAAETEATGEDALGGFFDAIGDFFSSLFSSAGAKHEARAVYRTDVREQRGQLQDVLKARREAGSDAWKATREPAKVAVQERRSQARAKKADAEAAEGAKGITFTSTTSEMHGSRAGSQPISSVVQQDFMDYDGAEAASAGGEDAMGAWMWARRRRPSHRRWRGGWYGAEEGAEGEGSEGGGADQGGDEGDAGPVENALRATHGTDRATLLARLVDQALRSSGGNRSGSGTGGGRIPGNDDDLLGTD